MAGTLRELLIERAARLQERPALELDPFGRLDYLRLRNRVEGVALGLMAAAPEPGTAAWSEPGPWAWIAELAATCCGLRWSPEGARIPEACLGGAAFNDEAGRQAYHDRERQVGAETLIWDGLSHGELLIRLRRLNVRLGWDHRSRVELPAEAWGTPEARGLLWSGLYAGAFVVIAPRASWDPEPFRRLLEP